MLPSLIRLGTISLNVFTLRFATHCGWFASRLRTRASLLMALHEAALWFVLYDRAVLHAGRSAQCIARSGAGCVLLLRLRCRFPSVTKSKRAERGESSRSERRRQTERLVPGGASSASNASRTWEERAERVERTSERGRSRRAGPGRLARSRDRVTSNASRKREERLGRVEQAREEQKRGSRTNGASGA